MTSRIDDNSPVALPASRSGASLAVAAAFIAVACTCSAIRAANVFAGLWLPGNGAHAAWITSDWNNFTAKWDEFNKSGLRMTDFEAYEENSKIVYLGLFGPGNDATAAWFTSDWDDFTAHWADFSRSGLRLTDFETYVDNGTRYYAGIYRAGSDGYALWVMSDWNDFTAKWDEQNNAGLRMIDFETWVEGRTRYYAGVFREGSGGHAAWFTNDWSDFTSKWGELENQGLRMFDIETWVENGKRVWGGLFREGTGGHYAWIGVDWENFKAKWNELDGAGYRLVDIEVYPGDCDDVCSNQVVMPPAPGKPADEGLYNYHITGHATVYNQPVDVVGNERLARLSALYVEDQIFTLPFSDSDMNHNGWLYGPGSWHHAIDYSKQGGGTFAVRAAAEGDVIYIGWDSWSGGTMIVSHDVPGDPDRYRTIYMHLRNGADHDCDQAWAVTVPFLNGFTDPPDLDDQYKAFLNATGCKKDPASRSPDEPQWGKDSQSIDMSLLGKHVKAGDFLAWAGSTGAGGCGCIPSGTGPNTHLHIFFTHRDPENGQFYFFDPYGIYGPPQCYPSGLTDPIDTPCARYPVAWKGGRPQLARNTSTLMAFRRGDANGDGKMDLSDAVASLSCLFLGRACGDCADAADADDNGTIEITDPILTLTCLFLDGQCKLFRSGVDCKVDADRTDSLTCDDYPACR